MKYLYEAGRRQDWHFNYRFTEEIFNNVTDFEILILKNNFKSLKTASKCCKLEIIKY